MLAALALSACDSDFTPASRIESPRILALAADRPFAHPGDEVRFELLVAGTDDVELSWATGTCTLPESSSTEGCLAALDEGLSAFNPEQGLPALQVPDDVLDEVPEAQRPSALIGVVVVACAGTLEPGETASIPATCLGRDGEPRPLDDLEVGVKRVFLREHDDNDNPRIEQVLWDDEPWGQDAVQRAEVCEADGFDIYDCARDLRHRIAVVASAPESGQDELGGEFEELVIVQFYATHGVFRDEVRLEQSPDNLWAAQAPDAGAARGQRATLWFVARDDRGGVSWARRQVDLR